MADGTSRRGSTGGASKKSGSTGGAKKSSAAKRTPAKTSRQGSTRGAKKRKKQKPLTRGQRVARVFRRIALGLAITLCLALIAGVTVGLIAYANTRIPDPNADFQTNTTTIYYRDGKTPMGTFQVQNRQSIPYAEMPQSIKDAVVAAENRDFWTDKGISITGLARSAWVILNGGDLQGGSTITQQYVKIFYLTSDQTVTRKLNELLISAKLAREVPKETILESYLNTIYFGRGAYGIQAAAQAYFKVDAKDLTLEQSAVLACVLNNPSLFDPNEGDNNAARLLERYRYALDGMVEMGTLDAATAATAKQQLPKFPEIKRTNRLGGPTGFLLMMVKAELKQAGFSDAEIDGGGLQVTSTFDNASQAAAVAAAQKYEKEANSNKTSGKKAAHATIASVDVGTGEVRALYAGADYVKNSRNWATTPRAAGSTFKSYALVAGLENGFSLRSTFNGNTFTPPGESTTIRNEFHEQYGPSVSLTRATALSINTAFVDMTTQMEDGPKKIIEAAEAAGVPKQDNADWYPGSRVALGVADVSALSNATGYATFANGGERVASHVVREVKDRTGKVIWKATPEKKQTIDKDVSRDVTYALSDVVDNGSGKNVAGIGRPVAGKTGTASGGKNESEVRSAWFVGYTAQISTAVLYVAGDSGSEDLDPYKRPGDGTFFGGTYPALTWAEYMEKASKGMEIKDFPGPAYVNKGSAAPPPSRTAPVSPNTSSQPPSSEPPSSEPPSSTPPSSTPPSSRPPSSTPPSSQPPTTRPPTTSGTTRPPTGSTSGATGGNGGNGDGDNQAPGGKPTGASARG